MPDATLLTETLATAGSSATEIRNVWDLALKGGVMMIPIGICSFIAVAVFFERLISLRRRSVIPPQFLPGLRAVLDRGDRKKALEYCEQHSSPVARVFAAGIKKLGHSVELIEKHIVEGGDREVLRLRKNLRVLQVIGAIAPLLGLLGTIIGMILAFQAVATDPDALGKTEKLANGIYQAMITTAAGLIVAIPVLVAHSYLMARIEKIVAEIDMMTVDFIDEYADPESAFARSRRGHVSGSQAAALIEPPRDTPDGKAGQPKIAGVSA